MQQMPGGDVYLDGLLGDGDSVRKIGSNVLDAAEDLIAVSSRARRFNDLALMA